MDDDADIISTFKMILEMNGFEVDAYTSPLSALSNFKPNEFGLLILDVRMPDINGFELYRKMKSIDSRVEACFITAFEDYREEFKESFLMLDEAKYFIRKPISNTRFGESCINYSRIDIELLAAVIYK